MSHVLFRGETATCFCSHCIQRNQEKGIDADRARQGYGKLYSLIKATEQNKARPIDGLLTEVLRILQRFPEVLSWDYQWFLADEEICTQVHHTAKAISPNIDSGRHVDHQRSSWDVFYRAAIPYSTMAKNADFIKPILYHETFGPRLRWWVLERMKDRVLNELSLEQSLSLFYSTFGHTAKEMPQVEELDANGLGATYVYNETKRCKLGVGSHAKVYAGIGIDVPWYVPGGMEPRPSRPDSVEAAVVQAFEAGADGVLASREYNEMFLSMKCLATILLAALAMGLTVPRPTNAAKPEERLRVIIETDAPGGDPDDEGSLVRFFLYLNEWDVEGILCTRRADQSRTGESGRECLERFIEAYQKVWPSLTKHDRRYPSPKNVRAITLPSYDGTKARNAIIAAVDREDSRRIWYVNWGTNDGNLTAMRQALDYVKMTRSEEAYRAFADRLCFSRDADRGYHVREHIPYLH
ncbi:unnamed protein product, partial [Symbiodinium sp. CCMP2456]